MPPRQFRLCLAVAAAALLGGAGSAHSQESTASRPWRLDLSTGVGYDDNLRFTPSMEAAYSGRVGAGLTRLMTSPRANLTLGASGEGTAYRRSPEFNQVNYTATLSANYLLSPRSTIRIGDSFAKGYTGDSLLLINSGLLFPRTVSRTNDATIEASHQISPRWNWNLSAQHRVAHFDSNLLVDTSSFGGRADLSWTAAPDSPIGLYYEFRRVSLRNQPSSDTHGAALRWARRLGGTLSLHLEMGAHKLVSQGSGSGRVFPTAAAGFTVRSLKQTFEAEAVRSVSEAFGLGRLQVRSAASLRFTRTLNTRFVLALDASLSRSQDPGRVETLSFDTGVLGGEIRFRLAQNASFTAAGGYRNFDPIASARTHSRLLTLTLRVGQNWGRSATN